MLKTEIIHPQLNRVLSELRHNDFLVIGDAGLPIPRGVERIDLGWTKNNPRYLDVLQAVANCMVIEGATFAEEAKTNGEATLEVHKRALEILTEKVELDYIPHSELKARCANAKAIILTGEYTGYTNVILRCGCAY
ncbi:MAG: D-ribose pyranase [Eubacteriales bacterium]|nr:D-ribose pyranase [Eubacteriales bacterium]